MLNLCRFPICYWVTFNLYFNFLGLVFQARYFRRGSGIALDFFPGRKFILGSGPRETWSEFSPAAGGAATDDACLAAALFLPLVRSSTAVPCASHDRTDRELGQLLSRLNNSRNQVNKSNITYICFIIRSRECVKAPINAALPRTVQNLAERMLPCDGTASLTVRVSFAADPSAGNWLAETNRWPFV